MNSIVLLAILSSVFHAINAGVPTRHDPRNDENVEFQPFQFFISAKGKSSYDFGSGVLISNKHILTVARMIKGYTMWYLGYGSNKLSQLQQLSSSNAFVHPNYDEETFDNNIGVIITPVTIQSSALVSPVALPTNEFELPRINEEGFIVGFGIQQPMASPAPSASLKLTFLIVVDHANECLIDNFNQISTTHFCARDYYRNTNLCYGDIGSAFITSFRGTKILAGFASIVSPNCEPDTMKTGSAYIRTQIYLPWISAVTGISV